MPIVNMRKVIQAGGSKAVALPPAWLRALNLDLGSDLLLVADGAILIVPQNMRLQSKSLEHLVQVVNRNGSVGK